MCYNSVVVNNLLLTKIIYNYLYKSELYKYFPIIKTYLGTNKFYPVLSFLQSMIKQRLCVIIYYIFITVEIYVYIMTSR